MDGSFASGGDRQDSLSKKIERIDRHKCYGRRKTLYVQLIYLYAVVFWLFLVFYLQAYRVDQIGGLILFIPIFTFGIGFLNASALTVEVEEDMFKANFLSIGLLIVLPLLTWMNRDYTGDRKKFIAILIGAIIFTMLSLVDIWVRKKWVTLVKHLKSVFQTFSLTLLILGLYLYYSNRTNGLLP